MMLIRVLQKQGIQRVVCGETHCKQLSNLVISPSPPYSSCFWAGGIKTKEGRYTNLELVPEVELWAMGIMLECVGICRLDQLS